MKKFLNRLLAAICTAGLLLSAASALTVGQAVELLEDYYVDDLPAAAYQATTLDELFQAIGDPYTYYMSAEEYKAFMDSVEGSSQVGIGVGIQYKEEGILISRIIPGGTAEEAGLEAGDIIVSIDGSSCVPGQESDVNRITGQPGTQVTIEVLRTDGTKQSFTLVRRAFTVPTATVKLLEDGRGYIQCDSFGSTTGGIFADGIEQYDGQAGLWLVDIRSNGGGLISAAEKTSGAFTGEGFIAWLRDANGNYSYSVHAGPALTEKAAVVLTNGYSASASEIFSSAIKDYGVGIVVGGRTYGKGVAQILLNQDTNPELFDGDALKITSYRFYSAALNTTDCVGTLPTLLVADGQAENVAGLLRAGEPENSAGWLRLTLNGQVFYVDAASALESGDGSAALGEMFAALPPGAKAEVGTGSGWSERPVPQAAQDLGVTYSSRWFTDVAGTGYVDELNTMAAYGLLQGQGDGTYKPEGSVTRAELCTMICRLLNRSSSSPCPFTDVPADAWYAPYVTKACEIGVIRGKGNGAFDPNGLVTQEELITCVGRLADFLNANCHELLAGVEDVDFDGAAIASYSEWARPYVWLLGDGYRDNVDENAPSMLCGAPEDIDPRAYVTRAEAGATLCRLLTGVGILTY